jgi:hypothetical protein
VSARAAKIATRAQRISAEPGHAPHPSRPQTTRERPSGRRALGVVQGAAWRVTRGGIEGDAEVPATFPAIPDELSQLRARQPTATTDRTDHRPRREEARQRPETGQRRNSAPPETQHRQKLGTARDSARLVVRAAAPASAQRPEHVQLSQPTTPHRPRPPAVPRLNSAQPVAMLPHTYSAAGAQPVEPRSTAPPITATGAEPRRSRRSRRCAAGPVIAPPVVLLRPPPAPRGYA